MRLILGIIIGALLTLGGAYIADSRVPAATPQQRDQALAKAQDIMLSFGLTGAADVGTSVEDWQAMRRAGDAKRLTAANAAAAVRRPARRTEK